MNKKYILLLLAALLLTSIACSLFSTTASDPNVLFEDDFSRTDSGWDRVKNETGETDYNNDAYRMVVKTPKSDIWANPGKSFDGDVRVEVDVTKVAGELDDDFGLICRYSGDPATPNFYYFQASSDGFVVIGKKNAERSSYLSSEEMEPNDAVKQGLTTNHLRADCIGNTLTLYVNGQQVASATDDELVSGDVGLMAGTFDIPLAEFSFDNFVVRKP